MSHRFRRMTAAVGLGALLLAIAACGIPEEDEPRAVAPERIPEDLQAVPSSVPNTIDEVGQRETVFMIQTDEDGDVRLVPDEVTLDSDPSPRALVASLLAEENNQFLEEDVQNKVPDDLAIVDSDGERDGVIVDDDLVRIRLNDEIQTIQAETLTQAIAQIVWTATQVGGIERVQLVDVNDDPIPVSTDDGAKEVVRRQDFAELSPLGS